MSGVILSQDTYLNKGTPLSIINNSGGGTPYPFDPTFGRVTADSVYTGLIRADDATLTITAVGGETRIQSTDGIAINSLADMSITGSNSTIMNAKTLQISTIDTVMNANVMTFDSLKDIGIASGESTIITGPALNIATADTYMVSVFDTTIDAGLDMRFSATRDLVSNSDAVSITSRVGLMDFESGDNIKLTAAADIFISSLTTEIQTVNNITLKTPADVVVITPEINAYGAMFGYDTLLRVNRVSTNTITTTGITVSDGGIIGIGTNGYITTDAILNGPSGEIELTNARIIQGKTSSLQITDVSSINGINWARISTVIGRAP